MLLGIVAGMVLAAVMPAVGAAVNPTPADQHTVLLYRFCGGREKRLQKRWEL